MKLTIEQHKEIFKDRITKALVGLEDEQEFKMEFKDLVKKYPEIKNHYRQWIASLIVQLDTYIVTHNTTTDTLIITTNLSFSKKQE
ncbi:MAG: hypothetical protein HAW60_05940 [Bdellovibrionales bacterium]|nr:hypothetical protein [Bdellovibrionales bacterium]